MKTLVILLLLGCGEMEEIKPLTGCVTAVNKDSNRREFLRCSTLDQFNPTSIRSIQWDTTDSLYYDYEWIKCDNCE